MNHCLQLSIAYETLSDDIRRTKYDAMLMSSQKTKKSPQPAWPPQTSFNSNDTTRLWRAKMQSRTWGRSSDAQEKADQARREDDEYWSGPAYYHGAYERNAWGEEWDPEQKDSYSSKHQERQRAARKEARREARRKKRDMNTPPRRDPVDHDPEEPKAKTAKRNEEQETWGKAEKDECYDDGSWTKSPSPQQPDPNWSERAKEKKDKKEQSARRKAERELSKGNWPTELLLLFSKIIALQVDIKETRVKVDASRRVMKVRVPQSVFFLFENGETCLGAKEGLQL